jgi:uncharacterized membrane protein
VTIAESVTIARPVADVYAYLREQANAPQWRQGVVAIEQLSGGDRLLGSVYRETSQQGNATHTISYRVDDDVPSAKVGFEILDGPVRPRGAMLFEADGPGATRVTQVLDIRATGLGVLIVPMLGGMIRKMTRVSLENARRILEQPD